MAIKKMFGEKDTENINGVNCSVIQTAKYLESKNKAIELIESKKYGLSEADFWILQNRTKSGNYVMYSGLIISHNGCLKINDSLPVELKFNQKYCSEPIYCEYTKGLRMDYRDEQGLYEVGEITSSNCKNEYPYAMLLKRLMDRVILKNSKVAFSGIYSEVEAEEFKNEEPKKADELTDDQVNDLRKQLFPQEQKEPEVMDNDQFIFIDKLSNEWHAWIEKKFVVNKWTDLNKEQAAAVIKIVKQRKKGSK